MKILPIQQLTFLQNLEKGFYVSNKFNINLGRDGQPYGKDKEYIDNLEEEISNLKISLEGNKNYKNYLQAKIDEDNFESNDKRQETLELLEYTENQIDKDFVKMQNLLIDQKDFWDKAENLSKQKNYKKENNTIDILQRNYSEASEEDENHAHRSRYGHKNSQYKD